ncbi:hypothetical protein L596_013786 [Steinernema carpocapsae]|uniref:RING-type domain-containing protein n=1 Tax=Steinernema carpocapsae TaxID=34508 RepID=A0A4U5P183_STECR|nr:hypothetical protein L596_013786 [Steinernema carpocapsae]
MTSITTTHTYDRLNCAICSDWLSASSQASSATCGHVFHKNCVITWIGRPSLITRPKNCPCCRTPLVGLRDLFFSSALFEQDASQEELARCYTTIEKLQKKVEELTIKLYDRNTNNGEESGFNYEQPIPEPDLSLGPQDESDDLNDEDVSLFQQFNGMSLDDVLASISSHRSAANVLDANAEPFAFNPDISTDGVSADYGLLEDEPFTPIEPRDDEPIGDSNPETSESPSNTNLDSN